MSAPAARDLGLSRSTLLGIYLRTLTLQASWNLQRMQNLGLLVSLLPWLRHQDVEVEERRRFCRRHFEFFNTNPYLAGYVVGGVLRLEAQRAAAGIPDLDTVRTFRDSLARSFAGLGDQLFWLGLRPTVLLVAALGAMVDRPGFALAVVGVFALGGLELRRRSLVTGLRRGYDLVEVLGWPGWHRAIRITGRFGKLLTGALAGCFFARILVLDLRAEALGPVAALAVGAALPPLIRKHLPGEGVLLITAALVAALGYGL